MSGAYIIYAIFAFTVVVSLFRPWIGIVSFYFFVAIVPTWNWSWIIPADSQFQKWIIVSTVVGLLIDFKNRNIIFTYRALPFLALPVYLAIAYVSASTSIAPEDTRFYMSNLWKIVLATSLIILLCNTPRKRELLIWGIVIGQSYNALRITQEYLRLGYCAYVYDDTWAFLSSNQASNLALLGGTLALTLVFYTKQKSLKLLASVCTILCVHQVFLMESRGVMLGLATSSVFSAFVLRKKRGFAPIMLLALVTGGALAGPSVVEEFSSIFADQEEQDSSAASRIDLWKIGWEITKDYPVLGVGPYAAKNIVPVYAQKINSELIQTSKSLHNLFFEVSAGCGIPAAIAFLYFFCFAFLQSIRRTLNDSSNTITQEYLPYYATAISIPGFFVLSLFSAGGLLQYSYAIAAIAMAGIYEEANKKYFLAKTLHPLPHADIVKRQEAAV